MARKWSNLNLPGALHYVTGTKITTGLPLDRFTHSDEPLAVDHDWWWPEDSEKLSQAMKEMGWYSFAKRR